MMQSGVVSTPRITDECLPEGKKMYSVLIDFTDLQFLNYAENQVNAAVFDFMTSMTGFSRIDFNIDQSILSQIKSVIFEWRPTYGIISNTGTAMDGQYQDFANINGTGGTLAIHCNNTGQTVFLGEVPGFSGVPVRLSGVFQMPCGPGASITLVNTCCNPGEVYIPFGRGRLIFCNYELPSQLIYGCPTVL